MTTKKEDAPDGAKVTPDPSATEGKVPEKETKAAEKPKATGPIAKLKEAKKKAEESKAEQKPWFSYKESEKDINRLLTRARNIPKAEKARGRYLKALTEAKKMLAHCKLKNLG